jgi:hypothetical protein
MPVINVPLLIRVLLVWLLIALAESLHGSLRRLLTDPDFEFALRQASVLAGTVIIFAITWFSIRWMRLKTATGALAVGVLWVALTLMFEAVVGRALGLGWDRILSDYDLVHGGLMPLGLVAMALTPWAVHRLRSEERTARNAHPVWQRRTPAGRP